MLKKLFSIILTKNLKKSVDMYEYKGYMYTVSSYDKEPYKGYYIAKSFNSNKGSLCIVHKSKRECIQAAERAIDFFIKAINKK